MAAHVLPAAMLRTRRWVVHPDRHDILMTVRSPVLTSDAMRDADRYTIEEFGISGRTLMEVAGREAAVLIENRFGPASELDVEIFCGKGNNGGDGLVIARYLFGHGAHVQVCTLGNESEMSEDAAANLGLLRKLIEHSEQERLTIVGYDAGGPAPQRSAGNRKVIVDALLGTGVSKVLRDPILGLVRRLNERSGFKIAVDIPTGIHADTGKALGTAFRADLTVTMGALKAGLCLNDGPSCAGETVVVDIGIPAHALLKPASAATSGCAFLTTDDDTRLLLPVRPTDAHKYSVGYALVVSGTAGMTGAPVMASAAAARSGAGYVSCACDERIRDILSSKLTEITTIALPAHDLGIDADEAMSALQDRLPKVDAALIGCGLGRSEATADFIRRFLQHVDVPVVIDADALNALAGHAELLREHANGRWVLTPHLGEFRRLAGESLDRSGISTEDRVRLTQYFAREWNCVLILKGMPSVVASPHEPAWIVSTGNTGLASAGTGDVLAGICAGLLSQGLSPSAAARAGLHIGGACADRYASTRDARTLQATDLIEQLPYVMKERYSL